MMDLKVQNYGRSWSPDLCPMENSGKVLFLDIFAGNAEFGKFRHFEVFFAKTCKIAQLACLVIQIFVDGLTSQKILGGTPEELLVSEIGEGTVILLMTVELPIT